MMQQLILAVINGIAAGVAVFMVAAGLTLIFGILRVLNFSHGGFFMIGAYVASTLIGSQSRSVPAFLGAALVAGLCTALLGIVVDRVVLRRLRNVDEAYMLIATFAVLLLCQGATKLIWGGAVRTVASPVGLDGTVAFGGLVVPALSLFIVAAGVAIFVLLDVGIHRTRWGRMLQAIAADPWMAQNLGVNVPLVFTGIVVIGFFLAGFAGGVLVPNQSLSPSLAGTYVLAAFIAIIVGGVGSVNGAFIAALTFGVIESCCAVFAPRFPPEISVYVAMIVFLLFRPQGIFAEART